MGVVNSDFSVLLYERVLPRGKYESFLKKNRPSFRAFRAVKDRCS